MYFQDSIFSNKNYCHRGFWKKYRPGVLRTPDGSNGLIVRVNTREESYFQFLITAGPRLDGEKGVSHSLTNKKIIYNGGLAAHWYLKTFFYKSNKRHNTQILKYQVVVNFLYYVHVFHIYTAHSHILNSSVIARLT